MVQLSRKIWFVVGVEKKYKQILFWELFDFGEIFEKQVFLCPLTQKAGGGGGGGPGDTSVFISFKNHIESF